MLVGVSRLCQACGRHIRVTTREAEQLHIERQVAVDARADAEMQEHWQEQHGHVRLVREETH